MNEKVRKLLAFEWLMFLIFGIFWATAMFLPLFLTGSFSNKTEFIKSMFIMWGLYLAYVGIRVVFLFVKSLIWAYLVSNFFFTSEREKRFAEEWLIFNLLFFLWLSIMSYPLYITGMFTEPGNFIFTAGIIFFPYLVYLVYRFAVWFIYSVGWAVHVTTKIK